MVRNDEGVQEMLNDSSGAEHFLSQVKEQLAELLHSRIHLRDKYQEMFNEQPSDQVAKYFDQIGIPYDRLNKIYENMRIITSRMKNDLDQ
mmetsp:Transcript_14033/g.21853  ORF Transcript_14033/g.21853 Transcript_14033/m.21853 type:complete len:90 (+) Transcript_14033:191-460(+)